MSKRVSSSYAWLAEKLIPYLLPFIAEEIEKQLKKHALDTPAPKKFIGK